MKKYYFILLSLVLHSALSFADCDLNNKIRSASSEYLSKGFLNAVYMFSDSKEVIEKGARGLYSTSTKKELEADQQMPIASATKTMTAAGILKLQERGLLNVNDPLSKSLNADSGIWVDNIVPEWANKVTLHNLLTHRSGISEYFMALKIDIKKPHDEINKDIANFATINELKFAPGSKHNYCNTNYALLGLVIEQVSGTKLGDFYTKEFFEPLGLKNTKLLTLEEAIQHQTNPETMNYPERYFVTPTGAKPHFNLAKSPYFMTPFSDGGVVSTTLDLVTWHQALHSGKVVSKESYDLMTTRHYEVPGWQGVKNYMGYGLYISELENGDVLYQHAGKAVAIRSESGCIPKKDLCFAVLSNIMDYIPKEMEGKIDIKLPENQLDIQHYLAHIFKAI